MKRQKGKQCEQKLRGFASVILSVCVTGLACFGSVQSTNLDTAWAQVQMEEINYRTCNESGQDWTVKSEQCTAVTSQDSVWRQGWYAVSGSVEITDRVSVSGQVHLILMDGCTLKTRGIKVSGTDSISIYAQSEGSMAGVLQCTGADYAAGIGGAGGTDTENAAGKDSGRITIYGGCITAQGGPSAAGIGGGHGGSGQNITIHAGTVTAKGGAGNDANTQTERTGGAGIGGGGDGGCGSNIRINGGTVLAEGAAGVTSGTGGEIIASGGGAGIGGGNHGEGTDISIYDGTITAVGADAGGAGIGGGTNRKGENIDVYGGTVNASGGGAGIGGGGAAAGEIEDGAGRNISIYKGSITAVGGKGSAGIGGGSGEGTGISIYDGTVTAKGGAQDGSAVGGAGIGGSQNSKGENIIISGGVVTATGGSSENEAGGAGIGGGGIGATAQNHPITGAIIISGGAITATGGSSNVGSSGAGIGGGGGGTVRSVSISNAVVWASGGKATSTTTDNQDVEAFAKAIGNGLCNSGNSSEQEPAIKKTDCMVFEGNSGTVAGDFVYDDNCPLSDRKEIEIVPEANLVIEKESRLEVVSGKVLMNNGKITNNGQLVLANKNCLRGNGKLDGNGEFLLAVANENFLDGDLDLCKEYNSRNQAEEVIDYVKKKIKGFGDELYGKTFKMNPGEYTNLPEEMRNFGIYSITCEGGQIDYTIKKFPLKIVSARPVQTSKTYDGSDRIKIRSVKISGKFDGDTVSVNTDNLYGSLRSSEAGTYYYVVLKGMKLTGDDAPNYTFPGDADTGLEADNTQLEEEFQIYPPGYVPDTGNNSGSDSGSSSGGWGSAWFPAARHPFIKNFPLKSGWTLIRREAEAAAFGTLLEIDMNGNAYVPKEMLQTVKDREISLLLDMGKGILWQIRGQDIEKAPSGSIDFPSVRKIESLPDALAATVSAAAAKRPSFQISYILKKAFEFPAELVIQADTSCAGMYANLFSQEENGGWKCVRAVAVSTDGTVRLTVKDAVDAILILDEKDYTPKIQTLPVETLYEAQIQTDGSIKITASDGSPVSNRFVTTEDGSLYYAQADGMAARNRVITVSGRKYFAQKNGIIAKSGFFVTRTGNKVYARSNGELMTDKIFQAGGRRYYAKPSGAVAKGRFFRTQSGKKVYAKASGVLVTNKIFRVRGKRFYADKKGIIASDRWVRVGNKKYYCSSSGKITKVKK